MTTELSIIRKADFNPKIKIYFLLYIALILTFTLAGIPLLVIWFAGLGQYISRLYYENLKCHLTGRHLVFSKGFLFKIEKTIPLENIQDLTFIENPLLRLFDLRILKIETAGQSNPHGSDMKLIGIVKSADFKQDVLHQRDLLQTDNRTAPASTGKGDEQITELLTQIRDLLNDIKNK